MDNLNLFLFAIYQIVILGIYAYVLKKIIFTPQNPNQMLITLDFFRKETEFLKKEICSLKEQVQELYKEVYKLKGMLETFLNEHNNN